MSLHYYDGFAGLPERLQPSNLPAPRDRNSAIGGAREPVGARTGEASSQLLDPTAGAFASIMADAAVFVFAVAHARSVSEAEGLRERLGAIVETFSAIQNAASKRSDAVNGGGR